MSDFVTQILGAMERSLDERFNSFDTAIPGIVAEVRKDGRIDVNPSIRKMVTSGVVEAFDMPVRGVPVMQIGFSGFSFDLELKKGDSVILLFFSRDATQWKARKWSQCDPKSPFANDLNSCVAIPFVRPDSGAKAIVSIDGDGVVTFDSSRVKFTGNVFVEGSLVSRTDVIVGEGVGPGVSLKEHVHPTPVGPSSAPTQSASIPEESTEE